MNSDVRHTFVVEPETLAQVQALLDQLVQSAPIAAGALIAMNGTVLASAGHFPLPEDQMGATAAGVFSALHALVPDDEHNVFTARSWGNSWELHFVKIDKHTFFLIVSSEERANGVLNQVLPQVVGEARTVIKDYEGRKISRRALTDLEVKLEELFSSCKKAD